MNMETPLGYPPPTLVVRKRSARSGLRAFAVMIALAAALGFYVVDSLIEPPAAPPPVVPGEAGDADTKAAALPDTAQEPPIMVDAPPADTAPAQPSVDARQPNRWYYVDSLADGPGAIYSRDGGAWSFAFACTTKTRVIEFIAVGTGSPGDFDQQSIDVGKVRLMMDAGYSKDGGGTMITTLPASHPFFNALDGTAPMEVRLHENRKTIVPVGPDVVRLIKTCRGRA
jgi:hypothetical protein